MTFPIYAIAGQSNAVGNVAPDPATFADIIYSAHQNNYKYTGQVSTLPTSVAVNFRKGGMEVQLAQRLEDAGVTNARIVKVAFGGTHMQSQWNRNGFFPADGSDGPDENLQEHLFERISRVVGEGGRLAAFVWWQGYTDAQDESRANAYEDNLRHLFETIEALYTKNGVAPTIYCMRLNSRWKSGNPGALLNLAYHDTMVTAQTTVCAEKANRILVDPDGFTLNDGQDGRPIDGPHYAAEGQNQAADDIADREGL